MLYTVLFLEPILSITEKIVYIGRQETEIPLQVGTGSSVHAREHSI